MDFLLLSILTSILITLIFKLVTRRKVNIFSYIVISYFIANLLEFALANCSGGFFLTSKILGATFILSILLIVTFKTIGISTKIARVKTISTSNKVSLSIPITTSSIFDTSNIPTLLQIVGFFISEIIGFMMLQSTQLKCRNAWKYGASLALVHFLLFHFFMKGLSLSIYFDTILTISNITILSLSVSVGFIFLKEKFTVTNKIGVLTVIISLAHLSVI